MHSYSMSGPKSAIPHPSSPGREPTYRAPGRVPPVAPPPDADGLPISEVSRLLAVPVPTLRSWELRYGIPDTSRSPGNHRRYYPEQLHALRLMRDEIVRGKRASAAARSVRAVLGLEGPARAYTDEFLAASRAGDPTALHAVLSRAHKDLGLGSTVDDVLMPGMRQIGLWWATGHCDMAEERLTTESVRGWLSDVCAQAPKPTQAGPVLLACGPTDQHTLGLEALATLLRHRGWNCRVLGARVPADALVTSARGTAAVGVVVVSHLASGRLRAVESIRSVERAGIGVFYAGNSFASPKSRVGVPGAYLGSCLADACVIVEEKLRPARARMGLATSS
jgi:hypothetical protein